MNQESNNGDGGQRGLLWRMSQMFSAEPETTQDLLDILRDAEQRNILSPDALSILEGGLEVFNMQAREIMVPRSRMVVLSAKASPEELVSTVIESGHSRFPVMGEDSDEVVGILLAKDLLPMMFGGLDRFSVRDVLRPASFVPESKRLNLLLRDFRATRNHMAVVVDEYGGIAGLITIEDVLEQIVGDISDEFDVESDDENIQRIDARTQRVLAHTPLDEFNRHFGTDFSADEFGTIGGIIMQRFGHLPRRNESIEVEGLTFKVLNADNRRIQSLHVTASA